MAFASWAGRRVQGDQVRALQGPLEVRVRHGDVRARLRLPEAQELERGPRVLGHQLDQAAGQGRIDELAGPECTRGPNVIPSTTQGRRVDVGQQHAFGEVE